MASESTRIGAPSPRLVLLVLAGIALVATTIYFLTRDEVGTTATSDAPAHVRYDLVELCSGQDIAAFADGDAFAAALGRAAGSLGSTDFDTGLLGCAENLSNAAADGSMSQAMAGAGLAGLSRICEQLRGSAATCAGVAEAEMATGQD